MLDSGSCLISVMWVRLQPDHPLVAQPFRAALPGDRLAGLKACATRGASAILQPALSGAHLVRRFEPQHTPGWIQAHEDRTLAAGRRLNAAGARGGRRAVGSLLSCDVQ